MEVISRWGKQCLVLVLIWATLATVWWWYAWSKARSRNQLYSHHGSDIKMGKAVSCFGFDVSNTCYSMMMTCLEWSTKQKSVILPSWKWYQDGESSVLFWFWYEQHLLQYDDDMPGVKHEAEISYTPIMEVISRWGKQCLVLVLMWATLATVWWWHAWSKARSRNQLYSHHGSDIKMEKAVSCFGSDVSNTCYGMMMTCLE